MKPRGAWPNLFVVGVARAGTTSLCHALGQHPDIFMSALKEPYFFSRFQMELDPFPKDEDRYLALFAEGGATRWRGEASTAYFWDEGAPHKIKRSSPDSRIVISLRNPVKRAYSGYWFALEHGLERRSFSDVIESELARKHRDGSEPPGHVEAGHYIEGLERYLELFRDVHILFFEELVADPPTAISDLYRFLDVPPPAAETLELPRENASRVPRNPTFKWMLQSPPARGLRRAVPPSLLSPLGKLARVSRVPEMDPATRRLLEEVFAPEREPLERLLGRPLPW